jgi:hypothetical protein
MTELQHHDELHDDHQGPPGPPGEKGTFPKEVTRAFVLVIVVAFLILLFVGFQAKRSGDVAAQSRRTALQAKAVASTVRQQAATIAQLRQAQLASCKNFETLKNAVNEFHGTIKSVLKAAEARAAAAENDPRASPQVKSSSRTAVQVYRRLLVNTRTVKATCAQRAVGAG